MFIKYQETGTEFICPRFLQLPWVGSAHTLCVPGGESPLTIRAQCGSNRYFPDPLGIDGRAASSTCTVRQYSLLPCAARYRYTVQRLPLWGSCHGFAVTERAMSRSE